MDVGYLVVPAEFPEVVGDLGPVQQAVAEHAQPRHPESSVISQDLPDMPRTAEVPDGLTPSSRTDG